MRLTKEAIIKMLHDNSRSVLIYDTRWDAVVEDDWEYFAEQLLSALQPNNEPSATIAANSMLGGPKAEPLALLEQELNRVMQIPATIQTAQYFEKIRRISEVQKAMALIGELQQKANGT